MSSPMKLRGWSRLYREMAEKENEPHLRRHLASHVLALAQLAEKIEREEAMAPE
jgi:hypothetical protein